MEHTPEQRPLIEIRELYEEQNPAQLMAMKAIHLSKMSDHEYHVNIINSVMDGYGAPIEIIGTGFYDANDGTPGAIEHEEDDRWQRSNN